jgi:hypothetical protein
MKRCTIEQASALDPIERVCSDQAHERVLVNRARENCSILRFFRIAIRT